MPTGVTRVPPVRLRPGGHSTAVESSRPAVPGANRRRAVDRERSIPSTAEVAGPVVHRVQHPHAEP